jgi:hypothetical protein
VQPVTPRVKAHIKHKNFPAPVLLGAGGSIFVLSVSQKSKPNFVGGGRFKYARAAKISLLF